MQTNNLLELLTAPTAVGSGVLLGSMVITIIWLRRQYRRRRWIEREAGNRLLVGFVIASELGHNIPLLSHESARSPQTKRPSLLENVGLTQAQELALASYERWRESRPNAIKLLWRIVRDQVLRMVSCSYKKARMLSNAES